METTQELNRTTNPDVTGHSDQTSEELLSQLTTRSNAFRDLIFANSCPLRAPRLHVHMCVHTPTDLRAYTPPHLDASITTTHGHKQLHVYIPSIPLCTHESSIHSDVDTFVSQRTYKPTNPPYLHTFMPTRGLTSLHASNISMLPYQSV